MRCATFGADGEREKQRCGTGASGFAGWGWAHWRAHLAHEHLVGSGVEAGPVNELEGHLRAVGLPDPELHPAAAAAAAAANSGPRGQIPGSAIALSPTNQRLKENKRQGGGNARAHQPGGVGCPFTAKKVEHFF